MKREIKVFLCMMALLVAFSCETKRTDDSKEIAEDANKEKFESRDVRKDADFLVEQVATNYANLQMAKLASQKSTHKDVKTVAKMLEKEHSITLEELKNMASQKAVSVPSEPEDKDVKKVEDLREEENATDFNKEWCKEMVDKHEKIIEDFEKRLENSDDADLKAWINQKLPGIRSHLDQLKAVNDKVKESA